MASSTYEIPCHGSHPRDDRNDGKAFATQFADRGLSYGCQHGSCSHDKELGNHWLTLRAMYEPDYCPGGGNELWTEPPPSDGNWPEPEPLGGELGFVN